MLPQIVAADAPLRILLFSQMADALPLLLFGNIQKQLHHQLAIIRQLALKTAHTLQPFFIFFLRKLALKISRGQFTHPA